MTCKEVAVPLKNRGAFYANINLDINSLMQTGGSCTFSKQFFFFKMMCVCFACIYICAPCLYITQGGQKRRWDPLRLELTAET